MLPNLSKIKHNIRIKHINVSIINFYFFHKNVFFLFLIINDTRASFIYILSSIFFAPSDNSSVIRINKAPGSGYLTQKHLNPTMYFKGFPW